MKTLRILLLAVLILMPVMSPAQDTAEQTATAPTTESLLARMDSLMTVNNMLLKQTEYDMSMMSRFKLYGTENIYTLLQLDTMTGRIEQVQWGFDADEEFSITINSEDLSYEFGKNKFELYPTQNMYQFILIDTTNGRKWHVQWGMEPKKRWIRRIY